MDKKNNVEVIINNKIYTICGFESEEYLQKIASYINVKYNDLKKYMENKLGFKFLNCKDLIFTKISDFEKMAIIDVTRNREDSRVSIKEMKNGWKPSWEE